MKPSFPLRSFLVLALDPLAAAQWSAPTPLANVNGTASDFDTHVTIDGLTLYFSTSRVAGFEIFSSTRPTPYGTFGTPVQVTELGSPQIEAGLCGRFDDLEVFFYSTRSGNHDIFRADRPSTSVPFNAPTPVAELNTTAADTTGSMTADGLRMYFASTRPGGLGSYDIYTTTRTTWFTPWATPTLVTELNSSTADYTPHISPDGLVIFYTSGQAGGLGGDDIWVASRLDVNSPFTNIVNVTALNTAQSDVAPSFALFHDELFMGSTRPGGPGSYDLHSTRFTGIMGLGIASTGSSRGLRFSDPNSPAQIYIAGSSLGTTPGIRIDTRNLPLNFDLLLQLSIGGLPPVFTGYVGALDPNGVGSGSISFAGFPQFRGLKFYTAFAVLDPSAPSGIKTISNADEVVVQ